MGVSRCAKNIACSNRFSSLVDEDVYVGGELNIDVVRQEACEVQRVRFVRKLKIATWNFLRACVVNVNRRKLVRF